MKKYLQSGLAVLICMTLSFATMAQEVDVNIFEKGVQQPAVQLFDVRTAGEFNSGHLAGALQADYTNKTEFAYRVQYLDKQKPVYVYCLSGGRSAAAAQWMRENGFSKVVEMEGGIRAWKQAGKPLEGGAKAEEQLSLAGYRQAIRKGLVLVDVGAPWCPPCRKMEPVLQQFLQAHPQVRLVKVDGGNDQQVMQSIQVNNLPTFVFYRDGKETSRKEGVVALQELEEMINL